VATWEAAVSEVVTWEVAVVLEVVTWEVAVVLEVAVWEDVWVVEAWENAWEVWAVFLGNNSADLKEEDLPSSKNVSELPPPPGVKLSPLEATPQPLELNALVCSVVAPSLCHPLEPRPPPLELNALVCSAAARDLCPLLHVPVCLAVRDLCPL